MVKVFITVDTEIWPDATAWPRTPLDRDQACAKETSWYFYGGAGSAARGLPYQLATLAAAGLKATYFVDPLFSFALGLAPLADVVALIRQNGQEVGLHLHPEWLTDPRCPPLPAFAGPQLHAYSETDQQTLIRVARDRLTEAGAAPPSAFRAGNWGANLATLRALKRSGIAYDTSLNARFGSSFVDIDSATRDGYTQPVEIEGVWEFPVTQFIDRRPDRRRPLHVCAASLGEFCAVLEHAAANHWFAVVIVLHSFEFVRIDRLAAGKDAASQKLLAGRFERLCDYLSAHGDRFETCHFADLDRAGLAAAAQVPLLASSRGRTAWRQLEQLVSRIY